MLQVPVALWVAYYARRKKEVDETMDDRQSAMLWQLMQSLNGGSQPHDDADPLSSEQLEHSLMSLRSLMSPKQQAVIDLMIKIQEVRALLHEIQQD